MSENPGAEFFGTPQPSIADEARAERHALIEACVKALTPMVTNETHAWNLWNYLASDRGAIRTALETAWRSSRKPEAAPSECTCDFPIGGHGLKCPLHEAAPSDTDTEAWIKYAATVSDLIAETPEIQAAFLAGRTSQPVQVEVTTVEELDAAFERADDAGETLTLRDRTGRDWITYGDENGYRWAWSVPHEDDAFTMPARIDGFEGFERFMPFTVFARPDALGGGDHAE